MKRLFWEKLNKWNEDKKHKPLLVYGARQVGKTYIIEEYCKNNYKNYCYINLFQDKRLIEIYESYNDFDKRIEFLSERYNINFKDEKTILFVDEVQECEEFIESLKAFCEYGYTNIICAGSLLGIKLKKMKKSFPVGKVHQEILYPMNFKEFLIATGNEKYIKYIEESYNDNSECIFHKELMELLYRFIYLGGMPEVIQNYIDNNQNLSLINKSIAEDIILGYMNDISKNNDDEKEIIRINAIYNNIGPQLIKENPKFMYAKFDKKNRKSDYITALDWLVTSNLVLKCNQITTPEYPIALYSDEENYKLFLSDTGLLRNKIGITTSDIFFENDNKYKRLLAENYVATELKNMYNEIYYWSRKGNENNNQAEVDFVIQLKTDIIPIEVKAVDNTKSKSLEVYNKEYDPKYMIRISSKNFGFQNGIKSIPLYAVFCINNEEESKK